MSRPLLLFVPANPHTIQLDIDTTSDLVHFHECIKWLSCICNENRIGIRGWSESRSRSGKNWHIEIIFDKPLSIIERIALQAIMGSDRRRELCNWERYRFRSCHPILFIKTHRSRTQKLSRKEKGNATSRI